MSSGVKLRLKYVPNNLKVLCGVLYVLTFEKINYS